ncbi:MAG TPA: metallophosphoesterase [Actinomycetota bacterium]|nr:metallophosphoesterase [Actinomycetota bacterium]
MTRLYFASDLHASEQLWRKFLNAPSFYGADVLIMGGDMSGKLLVPMVETQPGVWETSLFGKHQKAKGEDRLRQLEERARFNGFYPYRCDPAEMDRLERDPEYRDQRFRQVMAASLESWLEMAHDKLAGTGIPLYVMPGNDDPWEFDEVFARAPEPVENVEGRVVRFHRIQMLSSGWANPTPWDSPREKPEEELFKVFDEVARDLEEGVPAVFNLHIPPYDSTLDLAPELTEDLRVVTTGGEVSMHPVGSRAVRRFIEERQPILSLHGHIHESRGAVRIGRTLAVNPGSTYGEGVLDGAVVDIERGEVVSYQLVSG